MFSKPKAGVATRHLFVGNCGPAVGLSEIKVKAYFESIGAQAVTFPASERGPSSHVFVTFKDTAEAEAKLAALNGKPIAELGDRRLVIKFAGKKSDELDSKVASKPVHRDASACGIAGLGLHTDFVSLEEEQGLIAEVEAGHWETLARRRVKHYGYQFHYVVRLSSGLACSPRKLIVKSRNVDITKPMGLLPPLAHKIASRLEELLDCSFDQLTVNEYEAGVGLSAHVDTHSAFTGPIVSLSLAGPCVMEFRREAERETLFLPPRSLLVMADEARYAWHHYIPHRRSDAVNGCVIPRAAKRVSFTFRKVRGYPCNCSWPGSCDSQGGGMPPTRMALAAQGDSPGAAFNSSSTATEERTRQQSRDVACQQHDERQCARSFVANEQDPADRCTSHELQPGLGEFHFSPGSHDAQCDSAAVQHGKAQPNQQHDSTAGSAAGQQMESRYVHGVYDIIAGHFSATRYAIWPKVREFLESLPPAAVLADVGCGNGKYFGVRPDMAILGSDRSPNLAETASKRLLPGYRTEQPLPRCDVAVADGLHLPYRTGALDGVLCIAVLHHISTLERRLAMLAQLARVLRGGGRALVTVWASEQEQPGKLAKWEPIGEGTQSGGGDYFVPWHVPFHRVEAAAAAARTQGAKSFAQQDGGPLAQPSEQSLSPEAAAAGALNNDGSPACTLHSGRRELGHEASELSKTPGPLAESAPARGDVSALDLDCANARAQVGQVFPDGRVDTVKGTVVFKRYYHLFDRGELDSLVHETPGVRLASSFYDKSNWCVILQKL